MAGSNRPKNRNWNYQIKLEESSFG